MGRRILIFVAVTVALTVLAGTRIQGLGDRPLGRDEYYSASAVQKVLEHGVPAFHGGGHYPRALPMQYATAALVKVFGDNETTHRMLPALFGLLSIPLLYLLAAGLLPRSVAIATVVVFALSSWQVEFGRFARMYTALQFFTLLFFYAYFLAFRQRRVRWTYVPHCAALAAVSLHDLGVLLVGFLFITPWITDPAGTLTERPRRWKWGAAAVGTAALALGWLVGGRVWWNSNVVDPLPGDWTPEDDAGRLDRLGEVFSLPGISGGLLFGTFVLAILAIAATAFFRFRHDSRQLSLWLASGVMVVAAVFHQFALWGLALAYLIWRHDLYRLLWKHSRLVVPVTISVGCVVAWSLIALLRPEWLGDFGSGERMRAIRTTFLGLPDFYRPGLSPWFRTMPVFTIVAVIAGAYELWRIRKLPFRDLFWHPVWVVVSLALAFGVTGTPLSVTRYWFFIYPFILLLPAMALYHGCVRIVSGEKLPGEAAAGLLLVGVFLVTEDFNFRHLLSPNQPDVVYRTGEFKRFSRHWYPRSDERAPAVELGKHAAPGTPVILSSLLTASTYYLPEGVEPAMYMPRDLDPRFARHSRHGGTMDRWSGFRLLTDPEALREFTEDSSNVLVARVVSSRFQDLVPEEIWSTRLRSCERVAVSEDGRNEVLSITLAKPGETRGRAMIR